MKLKLPIHFGDVSEKNISLGPRDQKCLNRAGYLGKAQIKLWGV